MCTTLRVAHIPTALLLQTRFYKRERGKRKDPCNPLCTGFLLAEHSYLSLVKQQLDPVHHELQRERFLADWHYRKATNKPSKHDFIVTYVPGHKFFEDQHASKARKQLSGPQQELTGAEQALLEEILAVCGDGDNRAAYAAVIRAYPEGLLWMAIAETRQAGCERRITKTRGAYFMATVQDLDARWAAASSAPSL